MGWHKSGSRVNSNKGISLVEVMISVAILGVVSAGMMSLVNQQMKAVGFIEDKVSKESLKGVLLMMLSDTEICTSSFAGTAISASGVNVVIKDKAGNPKFDTSAGPVAYETNEIESIVLKGDPAVIMASTSGLMSLEVVVNRTRTGGGPSKFKALELPVYVSTDAGNLVSSCGKLGGAGNILLAKMSPVGTLLSNPPSSPEANLIVNSPIEVPLGATKLLYNVQAQTSCLAVMSNADVTIKLDAATVYNSSITVWAGVSSRESYRFIQDIVPGTHSVQIFLGNSWPGGCTWTCQEYSVVITYM